MSNKPVLLPGVSLGRITPAKVSPEFIYRRDLLDSIDLPAPFAIVAVAPSGFGKSVLAAQWAAQRPEITAWYTADHGDSAKDIFFHVVASLRQNFPGFAPWVEEVIEKNLGIEELAVKFSNSVAELGPEIRFVFDNLDAINGEEQIILRSTWTKNAPVNVKTFSTMRLSPAVDYSRAIKLGVLKLISANELKFNHAEISALAESLKLDIADKVAKEILYSADGWPAGSHLICSLLAKTGKNFVYDSALPKSETLILESAIKSLSKDEREILERTCFLNELTAESAEALSGNSACEQVLIQMDLDGLFISKNGSDPATYKINDLVRKFLQDQVARDGAKYQELAIATADVVAFDDPYLAFDLYNRAGKSTLAKEFALKNLRRLVFSGNKGAVNRFEKLLASAMGLGPDRILLLRAYMEAGAGEVRDAQISILEYESTYGNSPDRVEVESDIQIIKTRIDFLTGNFDSAIRRAVSVKTLQDFTDDLVHVRVLSTLQQAMSAAFLMEDQSRTEEILNQAEALPLSNDPIINNLYLPAMRSMHAMACGELEKGREFAILALKTAKKYKSAGLFTPFDAAYVLADIHRENGELAKSLEVLDEYIEIARASSILPWLVALMSKRALVLSHQGLTSEALNLIAKARDLVPAPTFGVDANRIIDEHELLIRVSLGDEQRIKELLFRMPKTVTTMAFLNAYAAMQSPTKAETILANYKGETARTQINVLLVAVQIYKLQNPRLSMQYLKEVVDLAMPNQFFQIFLQQRPEVQELIIELAGKQPTVYLERLASALRKQMKNNNSSAAISNNSLTKRELDILRRLSTGLPISQIAAGLHISNNTIKTHLKSVYKKMDVDSRHSAVAKAQEMQLL